MPTPPLSTHNPHPNRSARSPASPSPIIPRCLSPLMRSSFTILSPTKVSTCYHLTGAVDNKPRILPYVLALDPQCRLRGFCIDNKVVITVRTILVTCTPGLVSSYSLPRPSWPPHWLARTYLSSHSLVSLRKHFLHFLHAKTTSTRCSSACASASLWHSAQSNHFWQHGERIETCAFRTCLLRRWC